MQTGVKYAAIVKSSFPVMLVCSLVGVLCYSFTMMVLLQFYSGGRNYVYVYLTEGWSFTHLEMLAACNSS